MIITNKKNMGFKAIFLFNEMYMITYGGIYKVNYMKNI